MNQEYRDGCCVTTRVALLRHRAVSRMDSAERLIVTGIVSGLHRHDDNSWFVPPFSSGHIVVLTFLRHVHAQSHAVCVTPQPRCINASSVMFCQTSEMEDVLLLRPSMQVTEGVWMVFSSDV